MFAADRRIKLLTLGAMCFALFMAMLDNTVVNVALPNIQRHLGSGVSGLQWIIDAYTLVFASLMLSGGTLGDIFGRKRFFLIGLSVFTAGSLLCGLAPSLGGPDRRTRRPGSGRRRPDAGHPVDPHQHLPRSPRARPGDRHLGRRLGLGAGSRARWSAARWSIVSAGRASSS